MHHNTLNEQRYQLMPDHLRMYVAELPPMYNLDPLEALMKLGSAVRGLPRLLSRVARFVQCCCRGPWQLKMSRR